MSKQCGKLSFREGRAPRSRGLESPSLRGVLHKAEVSEKFCLRAHR